MSKELEHWFPVERSRPSIDGWNDLDERRVRPTRFADDVERAGIRVLERELRVGTIAGEIWRVDENANLDKLSAIWRLSEPDLGENVVVRRRLGTRRRIVRRRERIDVLHLQRRERYPIRGAVEASVFSAVINRRITPDAGRRIGVRPCPPENGASRERTRIDRDALCKALTVNQATLAPSRVQRPERRRNVRPLPNLFVA